MRQKGVTHGSARNEITESDAAEGDEAKVTAVPCVPVFPCIKENRS
jgi:hypothetical protein